MFRALKKRLSGNITYTSRSADELTSSATSPPSPSGNKNDNSNNGSSPAKTAGTSSSEGSVSLPKHHQPQQPPASPKASSGRTGGPTTPTVERTTTAGRLFARYSQSAPSRIHAIIISGAGAGGGTGNPVSDDDDEGNMLLPELPDLSSKVSYLKSFDGCVDAADGLAAASGQQQHQVQLQAPPSSDRNDDSPGPSFGKRNARLRLDPTTGLPDCSVLVSAEGRLLPFPSDGDDEVEEEHQKQQQEQGGKPSVLEEPAKAEEPTKDDLDENDAQEQAAGDKEDQAEESIMSNEMMSEISLGSGKKGGGDEDDDDDGKDGDVSETSHTEDGEDDDEMYGSAVYLGHDLHPLGDKAFNGFSARGWSGKATSAAIRQTEAAMEKLARFCEEEILTRKEAAARTSVACDHLRSRNAAASLVDAGGCGGSPGHGEAGANLHDPDWEIIDPRSGDFELTPERVGPLLHPSSTLCAAIEAMENFHTSTAENEAKRWRMASSQRYHSSPTKKNKSGDKENDEDNENTMKGILPPLRRALQQLQDRSTKRQHALEETSRRARMVQDRLVQLQEISDRKWNAVRQAEDMVTQRLEGLRQERSRERELQRLRALQQQQEELESDTAKANLGATDQEIWNMVSAVASSMDDGSFEPMDLPAASLTGPRDKAAAAGDQKERRSDNESAEIEIENTGSQEGGDGSGDSNDKDEKEKGSRDPDAPGVTGAADATGPSLEPPEKDSPPAEGAESARGTAPLSAVQEAIPLASREEVELELGLPRLRAAALAADEAVEDASAALLNMLSSLDTARRSARIAAETLLVSACNSQASCMRSWIQLERSAIEERLRSLEDLEAIVDRVDVRADLDAYITADKKLPGGRSHLGEDDDGGIASALAILNSHVDGNSRGHGVTVTGLRDTSLMDTRDSSDEDSGEEEDVDPASTERLNEAVDKLFLSQPCAPDANDVDGSVDLLCRTVDGDSSAGSTTRAKRSAICYALNSKRAQGEIPSRAQFDGLCRVFSAILTGCFKENRNRASRGGNNSNSSVSNAKMCMMLAQSFYVVDTEPDDGTGGGRHSEPERSDRVYAKSRLMDHELWSDNDFWDEALGQQISESLTHSGVMSNFDVKKKGARRQTRWHDLNYTERIEAASQVHAVVFAQLGALAHSMMEFGCGLERSCAFVRRMSIRNQLPSSQRTMLLQHLMEEAGTVEAEKKRPSS